MSEEGQAVARQPKARSERLDGVSGFDAVRVTAADWNGSTWDGFPFSGSPPWLLRAVETGLIQPKADSRDYAIWAVLTNDYGKPRWIAEPGDWIAVLDGWLMVLSEGAHRSLAGLLTDDQADVAKPNV